MDWMNQIKKFVSGLWNQDEDPKKTNTPGNRSYNGQGGGRRDGSGGGYRDRYANGRNPRHRSPRNGRDGYNRYGDRDRSRSGDRYSGHSMNQGAVDRGSRRDDDNRGNRDDRGSGRPYQDRRPQRPYNNRGPRRGSWRDGNRGGGNYRNGRGGGSGYGYGNRDLLGPRSPERMPKEERKFLVGTVTHFFPKVNAAIVKVQKGAVQVNDLLAFEGECTNFRLKIHSLQKDHQPVTIGRVGEEVGIEVTDKVREGDLVYRVDYMSPRG